MDLVIFFAAISKTLKEKKKDKLTGSQCLSRIAFYNPEKLGSGADARYPNSV